LVIPPPYIGFRALAADANRNATDNGLPFDVSVNAQYDASQNIIWYLPLSQNVSGVYDDVSFHPFDISLNLLRSYNYPITSMNKMTFTTNNRSALTDYVSRSPAAIYNLDSKGNYLIIKEHCNGNNNHQGKTLLSCYLQDISNGAVNSANNTFKIGSVDISSQIYTIQYAQDLSTVGVNNGSSTRITVNLTNAFLHDVSYLHIDATDITSVSLYGVSPVVDDAGEYSLQLYKYLNSSINYSALSSPRTSGLQNLVFAADYRYKKKLIKVPAASFGNTPYNLYTQRQKLSAIDVSNASYGTGTDPNGNPYLAGWMKDPSFNASNINFEFVALDVCGTTYINSLFDIEYPKALNANYITLPDIFTASSAEGSPVFRILYNGSTVAPMVSTSQVIINPIANLEALSGADPNKEFVDFNIGTNAGIMADACGNIVYV
jgi:hypothetical protein